MLTTTTCKQSTDTTLTMGKQSKRKSKGKNKQGTAGGDDAKALTLVQRLRHSDPRTRHAALAALSTTVLDAESLTKAAQNNKKFPVDLLQAIRDRVMDKDLECAQAAAGCLANYISFGATADSATEEITASWTIVLMERLKVCNERLQNKQTKQWWALSVQCLHALCSLIETNPQALSQLTAQNQALSTLLNLLEVGGRALEEAKSVAAAPPVDVSLQNDTTIYAARTLHSALDDNVELLDQWKELSGAWDWLQASCTNQALPVACRLHCTGCLVTARLLSENSEPLQTAVVSSVIPLLHSFLNLDAEQASSLVQDYVVCHKAWKEEEADDALEKEVIRSVNQRKESARAIARRQKEMRDQKEKLKKAMKREDKIDEMKEVVDDEDADGDMDDDDNGGGKAAPKNEDGREALEKARKTWHNTLTPLELALEITANLTSLGPTMLLDDDMEDMDMDGDWGPDQEAMLAKQQQGMEDGGGELSPMDVALAQAVVTAQIPARLVALLKTACQPLADDVLQDVKDDMEALQSKTGACLGNCTSENFPNWTDGLLQELRTALQASNGNHSIANAMAAALKARSAIRKQCQPSDLELLLQLASSASPCQKEAVESLGILCSMEDHPEDVNRKVCSALMAITSKKSAVINEVLIALMDIYGEDDCHPQVFEAINVLNYFQQTGPSFKQLIQCDRDDASEEELEVWKETALNASRFVSYKKGKL
jgi:hypothetical protein